MENTQEYFRDAKFWKSHTTITPDFYEVYHVWNIQFTLFLEQMENLFDAPTNTEEQMAEKLGQFIKTEFLAAVRRDQTARQKEWDEGEKKVTKHNDGSISTSLVNQPKLKYKKVPGSFTPVGHPPEDVK